jgi:hypothetical protein
MTSPTPTPAISRSALRYRKVRDRIIEALLLAAGLVAVFTTLAIVTTRTTASCRWWRVR